MLVNAGAVSPALQGFITVYSCDADQPQASTLDDAAGQTIANGALIALSPTGTLCIYTHQAMGLIVDINGWISRVGTRSVCGVSESPHRLRTQHTR